MGGGTRWDRLFSVDFRVPIMLTPVQRRDEGARPKSRAGTAGGHFTWEIGRRAGGRCQRPSALHHLARDVLASRLACCQLPAEDILAVYLARP